MNSDARPPCDCLNWCGDDPWLATGRSRPCDALTARQRERAEAETRAHRRQALLQATGHLTVDAALEQLAQLLGITVPPGVSPCPHPPHPPSSIPPAPSVRW